MGIGFTIHWMKGLATYNATSTPAWKQSSSILHHLYRETVSSHYPPVQSYCGLKTFEGKGSFENSVAMRRRLFGCCIGLGPSEFVAACQPHCTSHSLIFTADPLSTIVVTPTTSFLSITDVLIYISEG